MKCILLLASCLGLVALVSVAQAYPQRVYVQKLPYYPPPTRRPQMIRVRRDTKFEQAISTNPQGGQDVGLKATKVVGSGDVAGYGSAFVMGNTKGGDAVRGVSVGVASPNAGVSVTKVQNSIADAFVKQAEANLRLDSLNSINAKASQIDTRIKGLDMKPQQTSGSLTWKNDLGLSAGISRDINKGVSDTITKSVSANLFSNDKHRVDGTFFKSNVALDNGFKFDKTGGLLNYAHANGHGLNAGLTRFSGIGKQASVGGYSNLFTSNDGLTTLNANAGASKWLNGPFGGQKDYSFGLGLTHNGWRG
ncbi:sarcotoxin-2A-like [Lucilia sericata]|uniref:sarcotoxin-2A-like n=1 Tax=Lucilia sericata TaxID=13632 RepID=UPI0018A8569C|nr:sarcotoxin-2A-like [Lucilia sericata]